MDTLLSYIHFILHINVYLTQIVNSYGNWIYAILFIIVFCETGLVITPFLPGDSLLFAAGSIFAITGHNVHLLVLVLICAAFCGDNTNYWIGRYFGPKIFHNKSGWLRQDYLKKTHAFYERYGPKSIILARFIPIIRTFVPFVAGIGTMVYRRFILYSIGSAILWVCLIVYTSYLFGQIPIVKNNFSLIIALIIFISILPPIIEFIRSKIKPKT